jgi:hypothetical protein
MATEASYRPEAPDNGYGHILLSDAELADRMVLDTEARRFARRVNEQDENGKWIVEGCTDFMTSRAAVYALKAVQVLFSGRHGEQVAVKLLEMAVAEIEASRAAFTISTNPEAFL